MMKNRIIMMAMVWLISSISVNAALSGSAIKPVDLRCEYLEDPLGIDQLSPRLSWKIEYKAENGKLKAERGIRQTAYQILVATSEKMLKEGKADLWDSGKVESDQSIHIEYAGKPLESRMQCFWKVQTWTTAGDSWSDTARWTMGLLKPEEFTAKWIGVEETQPAEDLSLCTNILKILSASYQAVSGDAGTNVTEIITSKVSNSRLDVVVGNDVLGGDPAPGQPKQLVVEYELNGKPAKKTVSERERLAVNVDPAVEPASEWARPRYLRKSFSASGKVRRATAYVTALGLYEMRLNGKRVGDHLLAPEWTDYRKHIMYQTYDVTDDVRRGENAVAAVVGNGWFCGGWQHWKGKLKAIYGSEPFLMVQLEIEYADGSRQVISTDDSWMGTANGPLQFAGIYEGATYNAKNEMPGWDMPGFDYSKWQAVKLKGDDIKTGKLIWQRGEPIRATRELKPIALTEPKPGVYVFDMGQNMVGTCRFSFKGRAGEAVEMQHGEICNSDGTVFIGNLCVVSENRAQLDRYIFRGDEVETFEPFFTYHGFRYVEVRGLPEKPALDSLTGVVFNSDCPEVGSFTCSEPMLNRLALNVLWSQRGNYMGVPTDCPQRNERCGYTGDAQFFMRAAVYNMDVASFFNRWLVDVCQDSQMADGHIADHAPTFGPGDGSNIGWGDAGIICTYEIYRNYGDTRVIREHYAVMKRFMEWYDKNSKDGLFNGRVGNGDWLSTGGGVANEVLSTAYYAFNYRLLAEMADAIGEKNDAEEFRSRSAKISDAFAKAFIDPEGRIKDSSQTGYAMAFTMGLVPEGMKDKMKARFAEEMKRHNWHPRTGFIGTPRLLPGLHIAGLDEDAHKTLLTKTVPSWLYPLTVGATTIWEQWQAWDGITPRGGMQSHNHYSFGAVLEYLFGMIGGIQPDAPGYKRIKIQPVIQDGLTWAKTSYDSIYGLISTSWKVENETVFLDVVIPPNTTATVYVPATNADSVREGGTPAGKARGIKFLRMENGAAVFELGSGCYEFVVR